MTVCVQLIVIMHACVLHQRYTKRCREEMYIMRSFTADAETRTYQLQRINVRETHVALNSTALIIETIVVQTVR